MNDPDLTLGEMLERIPVLANPSTPVLISLKFPKGDVGCAKTLHYAISGLEIVILEGKKHLSFFVDDPEDLEEVEPEDFGVIPATPEKDSTEVDV